MAGVTNIDHWRITDSNPSHSNQSFDIERCAALHNHILELGWVGSGQSLASLDRRSWWEFHGEAAENIRHRLVPLVIEFLKRAQIGTADRQWNWHYYFRGLSYPAQMFEARADQEEGEDDVILLYPLTLSLSHARGVVFHQRDFDAIVEPTIMEEFTTTNGRQLWHPLETLLDGYIDIIEVGKVEAVADDFDWEGPPDRLKPWIFHDYSDAIVTKTVDAFNDLVDAIENRIPSLLEAEPTDHGPLIDEAVLDTAKVDGFAKAFLSQAKRPRIKYIAPGISIPSPAQISNLPFSNVPIQDVDSRPPILLFQGDDLVRDLGPAFGPPFDMSPYPSGLYLSPIIRRGQNTFEDETKFLLPFKIGGHGFAKTSDSALIGEDIEADSDMVEAVETNDQLYQPGYNPYIEMHHTQLYRVLESWVDMIVEGDWDVDEHGVVGGIEKFKEADTEEHWDKYVLLQDW